MAAPRPAPQLHLTEAAPNRGTSSASPAISIERADRLLGPGRVRYIHPDCSFWMLKRSIADAKIRALVVVRNKRKAPHDPFTAIEHQGHFTRIDLAEIS